MSENSEYTEMVKRLVYSSIIMLAVAGCTGPTKVPLLNDAEVAEMEMNLDCNPGAECDLFWRRAQYWIAQNAGMKIQVATDVVIETYGVTTYSNVWAFRAIREPLAKNQDRIHLEPSCGSVSLCRQTKLQMIASFRRYVRGAQ
jgi:hypothetical protein